MTDIGVFEKIVGVLQRSENRSMTLDELKEQLKSLGEDLESKQILKYLLKLEVMGLIIVRELKRRVYKIVLSKGSISLPTFDEE
ncbi:MAG: hypothetical protein DRN81_02845 [Thermoproteota archaeon]|nr:MAG: hypothetical protein DRN81_02845 [Candidatus Korarchaeota archaeon]